MPVIIFDNGIKKKYKHNVSLNFIINDLFLEKKSDIVAGLVDEIIVDLKFKFEKDTNITLIYKSDINFLNRIRFSCIQLLNYSLKKIWPQVKIVGGCITNQGFYCDFDLPNFLLKSDLKIISKKMFELVSKGYKIFSKIIKKEELLRILNKNNDIYQIYKLEKNCVFDEIVPVYIHEEYMEYSNNLQVSNIKFCKNFLLENISGVYWKNNKNKKMLQRISGVAWASKNQLLSYLYELKKSKNRDHRKISKKLDLYHIEKNSPGMIFWHHNGYVIFRELKNFIRFQLQSNNYLEVKTPFLINKYLWEKSGHWDYYKNFIFLTSSEDKEFCIKPMNCPGHIQIFKKNMNSYKNLPIRMSEFGCCHRNESSGSLHGLMRIRSFTQDDAHIFCTLNQIKSELNNCINLILKIYKIFGFKNISVVLSTRPVKRIGNDLLWDRAEEDLKSVLLENKISFIIEEGNGAFYGPKIEISLKDSLNRIWQCGTIQLDFYLPKNLEACYIDKNNKRCTPIMIHRAILGSIERFLAILLEEYSGKLPLWLSPIQVVILSIAKKHIDFVIFLKKIFQEKNIRVLIDISDLNISSKIKIYVTKYIPYLLICGDKEIDNQGVTVRLRSGISYFEKSIYKFIDKLTQDILSYKNTSI